MESTLLYLASEKSFFEPTYTLHHDGMRFGRSVGQIEFLLHYHSKNGYVENDLNGDRIPFHVVFRPEADDLFVSMRKEPRYMFDEAVKLLLGYISTITDGDPSGKVDLTDEWPRFVQLIRTHDVEYFEQTINDVNILLTDQSDGFSVILSKANPVNSDVIRRLVV